VEISIRNANLSIPLWSHFLMNRWEITVQETPIGGSPTITTMLSRSNDIYRMTLSPTISSVRLSIKANCVFNGTTFPLVHLQQDLAVSGDVLTSVRWKKGGPKDPIGLQKGIPSLHPLLKLIGTDVQIDVQFVDITDLYLSIHGSSAWLRTLMFLRSTEGTIRIMAALGGHPMIWYLAIPASVYSVPVIKPAIMVMPADYGAISYEYSLRGLQSSLHGVSVGNIQSGAEILARVMIEPLSDDRYEVLLPEYIELRKSFRGREDSLPAALHHFRGVLTYEPKGGELRPLYWDVPLGFERAIFDRQYVLIMPLMNGGEGGVFIKHGLYDLISSAMSFVYTHGSTLNYDSIQVSKPVLMVYSQSGGNLFTAVDRNKDGVGGIVLFEPQYMNDYLKNEDNNLTLGKKVISELIRRGIKVVLVGRYKDLPRKYLPNGDGTGIVKFPDEANYSLLTYPFPAGRPLTDAHPLLKLRYSRLVDGQHDKAIGIILGSEDSRTVDQKTIDTELKIDQLIATYRKAGMSDEALVQRVFSAKYLIDDFGGFYLHNLILFGGQVTAPTTGSYRGFIDSALEVIG
jgi:hypothetical protein